MMAGALVVFWTVLMVQAPDTAVQNRYGAAIQRVSDSLSVLEGATAMFQADLMHASPDLVISRATRLKQHCTGSKNETWRLDSLSGVGSRFRREIALLRAELARCEKEFAIGPWYQGADSVKAWAPHRLARMGAAVRRFRFAARASKPNASLQ